jgi:cytochrome P450
MSPHAQLDPAKIVDIDLGGAALKADARRQLAAWALRPPFYVLGHGPPQVVAGRYADAHEVFSDTERFSSAVPRGPGYEQYDKFMGSQFITQMDGEQHARLRRLLMPAFSPRRLAQIEGRVTGIVDGLIDDIEGTGPRFDGMEQFAARLVVGVLLTAMFNLEPEQQRVLLEWQEVQPITTSLRPGEAMPEHARVRGERAAALVRHVIAERRDRPRSDFLGDLVAARDQGDRLTDTELYDQIFGIFAAIATTPRSTAGALYELYTHRDQLEQLIADPTLIPEAVEECLRIAGNGYFTFPRIATRDTEIGGTVILKGMIVRPSPQAANYDPAVFPDPLRFDIHRKPRRIMTFGAGPHHCIGNALGRMTIITAIRRLLARLPGARLEDPGFEPSYGGAVGELRMKTLPMTIQ